MRWKRSAEGILRRYEQLALQDKIVVGSGRREVRQATQDLRNAPRLRNTSSWRVGRLGVEDFGHAADAEVVDVLKESLHQLARAGVVVGKELEVHVDERAD